MSSCPRCLSLTDDELGYCGVCGRPRIVEGLRASREAPAWHRPAWQALTGLIVLWLLVTLGVAFLREAKATRLSRNLLAENRAQEAWSMLSPFLQDHPRHQEALFLCGKATIRLGLAAEAKQCLASLGELAPELAKELGQDYQHVLIEKAQALPCNTENFEQLVGWEELGASFKVSLTNTLDQVVQNCRASGNYYGVSRLAAFLAQNKREIAGGEGARPGH